jgi:hypothetical protein
MMVKKKKLLVRSTNNEDDGETLEHRRRVSLFVGDLTTKERMKIL